MLLGYFQQIEIVKVIIGVVKFMFGMERKLLTCAGRGPYI